MKSCAILLYLFPFAALAQDTQPTSAPSSQPTNPGNGEQDSGGSRRYRSSDASGSDPADERNGGTGNGAEKGPESAPSSQSQPSSEQTREDIEITPPMRALKLLPPASLVLRGLPEPIKNIRVGLHADHVVLRDLPTDVGPDLTSFDSLLFTVGKRLYTGLTLEARFPITHQARNDFDVNGDLVEATQDVAFGNISLTLNQTLTGKLRKVISVELILPTAGTDAESLQTGALSTISSRYELPLFLPGLFGARARFAAGSTFSRVGIVGELGLDALFSSGDTALPIPFQLDLRGGASMSYQASDYVSLFGELTFAASLNDEDNDDGFIGDIDNQTSLHFGGRGFLGRVSIGAFISIPQDEPLNSLSTLGLGIDVFSALF